MSTQAIDRNGKAIPTLRPGGAEKVALDGTNAASATAVSANSVVLRIVADVDVHYDLTGTATASSNYLPADTVEYIRVHEGDTLSTIAGAAGNIYVTEML